MGIKMTEDVLAYENLVRHVVNKYNFRTDYDDLYQAGMMGLIMAFKKYDQTRESNFLDYAYFYIKGEVLKTLNSSKEVKISSDTYKLNKEINDTREDLVQRLGREPTPLELSYILGVSEEKITNTIIACQTACSLDDNNMDNDSSLYNKIALLSIKKRSPRKFSRGNLSVIFGRNFLPCEVVFARIMLGHGIGVGAGRHQIADMNGGCNECRSAKQNGQKRFHALPSRFL